MKLILLPYKPTSSGAKMMARRLKITPVPRDSDLKAGDEALVCINWGRGDYPWWGNVPSKWINSPNNVMQSIDKLRSMRHFRDNNVPTPEWTTDHRIAQAWVDEGKTIFARTVTVGMDGQGIVVVEPGQHIPHAPLYTVYKEKQVEYRVHVMNGECFYVNEKRPGLDGREDSDPRIRTTSGGWYFRHRVGIPINDQTQKACVAAVKALGLDFAGVDVGVDVQGNPCVYEVNTAPEMGPNTTEAYFNAFKKHYGKYKNNENIPINEAV